MANTSQDRPLSPSQLPPVPGSPTYSYASTAHPISPYNVTVPPPPIPPHTVLSKQDVAQSQAVYASLLSTAKTYRQALADLSTAASAFGSSLESCARLKESRAEPLRTSAFPSGAGGMTASFTSPVGAVTADTLLAAAGLHHLVSNHQQILSETVYRAFEVPLLDELDRWRRHMEDEEDSYKRAVAARSNEISRLEKEGAKLQKARRRDIAKFREHLVELTRKLDGLTELHARHAAILLRESQDTSLKIMDATCSLVRAEVEIFESLARKGWSGGGLEGVLEKGVDLFASEDIVAPVGVGIGTPVGTAGDPGIKLFSILPPKSILAEAGASSSEPNGGATMSLPRPAPLDARADSLAVEPTTVSSQGHSYGFISGSRDLSEMLAGSGDLAGRDGAESDSIFNEARARRPFSPQPIRRATTDATFDSFTMGLGEPPKLSSSAVDILVEEPKDQSHDSEDQGPKVAEDQPLLEGQDREEESTPSPFHMPLPDVNLVSGQDEENHPWRDEGKTPLTLDANDHGQGNSPGDGGGWQGERERGWTTVGRNDSEAGC